MLIPTNLLLLLGVLQSVPVLVKIDQDATARVRKDGYTDTLTDANRFYNLSHAICYSDGADKDLWKPSFDLE